MLTAGDGNRGVQTAAFNLPNDERVIREKGSKRVMLKNVQDAKFRTVLLPIAKVALPPADQKNVSFDAFFTHILMHELMHGLGPHNITVGGRATTVRQELKETYSAIEEAKALGRELGRWRAAAAGRSTRRSRETMRSTSPPTGRRPSRLGFVASDAAAAATSRIGMRTAVPAGPAGVPPRERPRSPRRPARRHDQA